MQIKEIAKEWKGQGIPSPLTLICTLLADFKNCRYEDIYFYDEKSLSLEEINYLNDCFLRLKQDEPLSKILGHSSFYGRNFKINKHVLDPRVDSECLIDAVIEGHKKNDFLNFLDLGTGSGCLVITLLLHYLNAKAVALDISQDALSVAQNNAGNFSVKDRLSFLKSHWFNEFLKEDDLPQFDCIVANPPYIASDYPLEKNVKNYDPHLALFSGQDGFDAYREIFSNLSGFLKLNGLFYGEIGFDQKDLVRQEIQKYPTLSFLRCIKDDQKNDRVIVIQKVL